MSEALKVFMCSIVQIRSYPAKDMYDRCNGEDRLGGVERGGEMCKTKGLTKHEEMQKPSVEWSFWMSSDTFLVALLG